MTAGRGRTYGPRQFPDSLGLSGWEFARALADGLIPPAGPDGRWPAEVVEDARGRLDEIRARIGDVPDLGASRAAEVLAQRLGVDVDPDAVVELARAGLIERAGSYKGHRLYSGRSVAAFRDRDAFTAAARTGWQRTRDEAAAYLRVRPVDVGHLVRAGRLRPVARVHSGWQRRREAPAVQLFRTGDLDELLADPTIDWAAVRATPPGRRSPLADLPDRGRR